MRIGGGSRDRPAHGRLRGWRAVCLALLCLPLAAPAQEEPSVAEVALEPTEPRQSTGSPEGRKTPSVRLEPLPPPEPPAWPGVPELAEALAGLDSRVEALLTIATLMTLRDIPPSATAEEAEARVESLQADRVWLDTLVDRYGYAEARSPVLDPAAWQVQVQLDRVNLPTTTMTSPLGSGQDDLAVGMVVGQRIRRRLPEERFRTVFFVAIFILGGYIIANAALRA